MMNPAIGRIVGVGLLVSAAGAGRAIAQGDMNFGATVSGRGGQPLSDAPAWVISQIPDPDDPRVQEYARQQKARLQLEKELYKIRFQYIHNIKNQELRSVGIHKIREYTQPAIYESLLKIFGKEDSDVRKAVLEHLADQKNDMADTTIAWAAVFGKSQEFRAEAGTVLKQRIKTAEDGTVQDVRNGIKSVVAEGLRSTDNDELTAAAGLAQQLKLIEAIPMLINAQIQGQTVGGGGGDTADTSLAWILVGTQQAFVSDLTPVVGNSAVAFDPTVSVITEGTYLRVIDAAVVTYRVDVHNYLVSLSSEAWGQPTNRLGWDNQAWHDWYKKDFVPYLAKLDAEKAEAKSNSTPR
jgi:hypothetical protein